MKYIKKYLFLFLLLSFFFIPYKAYAYDVHCYLARENWQVLVEGYDQQCYDGILTSPDYPVRIVAVETTTQTISGNDYKLELDYTLDTNSPVTAWETGHDIGPYEITNVTYNRTLVTPSSPSPPSLNLPSNYFTKRFDSVVTFKKTGNYGKIGYYWYYDNEPLSVGRFRILLWRLTNLSGADTDTNQIIKNDNKNTQEIIDNQNENTEKITESIDSIGDELVDETAPSTTDIEDIFDDIPVLLPGPISNLILLPITILTRFLNETDDYCDNISLNLPYSNEPIVFHCFKFSDYLGDIAPFITMVGVLFIFYQIAMLIISCWDSWTSLDSTFSSMYQPVHTLEGYKPRHAEGGKK